MTPETAIPSPRPIICPRFETPARGISASTSSVFPRSRIPPSTPNRTSKSAEFQIYRPAAWDHTTFADQLSGVRHLARITKAEIREAVRHSHMPDFYQESLAWRLVKRRDLLAKTYDVPLRDGPAGEAPTIAVPLTTRADRAAAAAKYCIPLSEIENDLVRTGHLDPANRSGRTAEPFLDVLAEKATLPLYHETVLSGIIRDFRHPPGFVERMNRFNDGDDYQSKRFGMKE